MLLSEDDLLDDNSLVEKYSYASLEKRVAAGAIDVAFFVVLSYGFQVVLKMVGSKEQYILLLWLVAAPLYKLLCDGTNGYTLGKKLVHIKLVQDQEDFPPLTWLQAWKRVLIFLPLILYFISFVFFELYVEERYSRATSLRTLPENSILITNIFRFCRLFEWPWMAVYGVSLFSLMVTRPPKTLYDFFAGTVCVRADLVE